MGRVLKIASAFIAVVVGAGFASGQEILQFFTSFGYIGTFSAIISMCLFTYFGWIILKVGSRMQTTSYKEAIEKISGYWLGKLIDIVLIGTLFGVGVVMIAGAGSLVQQQFGLSPIVGSFGLAIVVICTMFQQVNKVISIISATVPLLVISIVVVAVYSIITMEQPISILDPIAKSYPSSVPHWGIAAVNYVSYNLAIGAGMGFLIGGAEPDEGKAAWGGLVGGLVIGILILLTHLAIFSRINTVIDVEMPILLLANNISREFGTVMTVVLLGMIFSTAVGAFYTFVQRFFEVNQVNQWFAVIVTVMLGFAASFIGFTKLVALFYPLIGYLGLVLMIILIISPFKLLEK